jgi:hypothetical protein
MKIQVKSIPEMWEKEKAGTKANTLRELDGNDIITVINTQTGETFERTISDITVWKGKIIISWMDKNGSI